MEISLITTFFRSICFAVAGNLIITVTPAGAIERAPLGSFQRVQWDGDRGDCRDYDGWDRERCFRDADRYDDRRREERWREKQRKKKEADAAIAAGVIGLAIGAIAIGAASEAEKNRRDQCTFIGRDGQRYRCR